MLIEHFHGADTAFPHRAEGYNLPVLPQWLAPSGNDRCIAWGRNAYAAMQPFMSSSRNVNYLSDDDQDGATAVAYGPDYPRLRELKTKYDPENFFRLNQNIRPLG